VNIKKSAVAAMTSALIACSSVNEASAKPCEDSKWKLPVAVLGDITYGMSLADAKASLNKRYGAAGEIVENEDSIAIVFRKDTNENFDFVALGIQEGVVTKVSLSYSNAFQMKLGGPSKALIAVIKKMIDVVGQKADSVDKDSPSQVSAKWVTNNGASLEVVGKDPATVFVRYICRDLETELSEKRASTTNFGF